MTDDERSPLRASQVPLITEMLVYDLLLAENYRIAVLECEMTNEESPNSIDIQMFMCQN